jgi:hypothetical protein
MEETSRTTVAVTALVGFPVPEKATEHLQQGLGIPVPEA